MPWIAIDEALESEAARRELRLLTNAVARAAQEDEPAFRIHAIKQAEARAEQGLPLLLASDRVTLISLMRLLRDLVGQGWSTRVADGEVQVLAPTHHASQGDQSEATKEAIRAQLHAARQSQLEKASTRSFVERLERKRRGPLGRNSVFDLMRDGRELSDALQDLHGSSNDERIAKLGALIQPYLQVIQTADERCKRTGLKLYEIWRYFRHTWANPYKSVPGRSMAILVRDRAHPAHPVIGIAALNSPVVQLGLRDRYIGWEPDHLVKALLDAPDPRVPSWLQVLTQRLIEDVYLSDFLADGIISQKELRQPTEACLRRLQDLSESEKARHVSMARSKDMKRVESGATPEEWEEQARTPLYRSKRAHELSFLLQARVELESALVGRAPLDGLAHLLSTGSGRRIVKLLVRRAKREKVGISMADIGVCGAIAPYNHLLGGKLVAMLLTSPELCQAYRERYDDTESIIASSMAGRPIVRTPELVFLSTTSLYSVHASQYNRIKIPRLEQSGRAVQAVAFKRLGVTKGYGSMHLSQDTTGAFTTMLSQDSEGRRVNFVFGEGVSPRLRLVREALEHLDLDADGFLQHGNPRVFYGIDLADNTRDFLLGLDSEPTYLFDHSSPKEETDRIVGWWTRRWLLNRSKRQDVLDRVASETLIYPVRHGARVVLPPIEEEGQVELFPG